MILAPKFRVLVFLSAVTVAAVFAAPQRSSDSLKSYVIAHRWFDLRDEVDRIDAPPYFRAVVASAFNRPDAESEFRSVIRTDPNSEYVRSAQLLLFELLLREGRYKEAVTYAQGLGDIAIPEDLRYSLRSGTRRRFQERRPRSLQQFMSGIFSFPSR